MPNFGILSLNVTYLLPSLALACSPLEKKSMVGPCAALGFRYRDIQNLSSGQSDEGPGVDKSMDRN